MADGMDAGVCLLALGVAAAQQAEGPILRPKKPPAQPPGATLPEATSTGVPSQRIVPDVLR